MGHGELTAVVDAGPLIHLLEIGCLQFLNRFDPLHLPDTVWLETVGQGRVSETDMSVLSNMKRHAINASEIEQFIKEKNLSALHSGDQECFFVCLEQQIPILLTDDMALRTAARRFNIIPVGSLGIVVAAFKGREMSLEEAEGYIADLYDVSSLFVTRAIAELAIEQLRLSAK